VLQLELVLLVQVELLRLALAPELVGLAVLLASQSALVLPVLGELSRLYQALQPQQRVLAVQWTLLQVQVLLLAVQ
jgi:hypothetical protein